MQTAIGGAPGKGETTDMLPPKWVQHVVVSEIIDMPFCGACRVYHFPGDHKPNIEPVEPDIKQEVKIAGLLKYSPE